MLKKECFPNRSIVSSLKTWEPKIQIIKLKIFMYAEKNQRQLIKLKIIYITFGNLDSSGGVCVYINTKSFPEMII